MRNPLESLRRLLAPGRDEANAGPFAATRPFAGRRLRPGLIFRLKAWPQLPENGRTAEIYRIL
ncbi:MAG TPA: hypothetical protein VEB23_16500, partial [Ramlibacter sp.]|nr:hypothetical protein [Ramlibacter sp.]